MFGSFRELITLSIGQDLCVGGSEGRLSVFGWFLEVTYTFGRAGPMCDGDNDDDDK